MAEKLDCTGMMCPMPIVKLSKAMKGVTSGDTLEVSADDAAFEADVRAWCQKMKHTLKSVNTAGSVITAVILKS